MGATSKVAPSSTKGQKVLHGGGAAAAQGGRNYASHTI